jgi:MFS transporter, FHS family, glucose/mannose:H+ symporter
VDPLGNQTNTEANGAAAPDEPAVIFPGEVSGFFVDGHKPLEVIDVRALAVTRSAYAITLLAGLQAGWFGPLLPSIAQAQHLPLEKVGVLVSAVCAGGLCALAVSRPIIARLGDLKTTLLAATLIGSGFIGLGSLAGLIPLVACAFCYGMGVNLNSIASHILFPRYYPSRVASALSKLNVFFGVGALIGPMIALTVFSLKGQYNWVFAFAGLYSLVICAYLMRADHGGQSEVVTKCPDHAKAPQPNALRAILTHPILIGLTLINFLYVGIESSLGTWIYTFLQRAESLDGVVASSAVSLLWAGLTLGRLISTRACLKVNPKYVTMAAMLFLVSTIFATATLHMGANMALPMVLLIGLGLGPIFPTVIAQSATRFPTASSATTTIVIAGGCFGGMLLPWLGGYALASFGAINFMYLTGTVALFLPILLGLALFPIWQRRPHQES